MRKSLPTPDPYDVGYTYMTYLKIVAGSSDELSAIEVNIDRALEANSSVGILLSHNF